MFTILSFIVLSPSFLISKRREWKEGCSIIRLSLSLALIHSQQRSGVREEKEEAVCDNGRVSPIHIRAKSYIVVLFVVSGGY